MKNNLLHRLTGIILTGSLIIVSFPTLSETGKASTESTAGTFTDIEVINRIYDTTKDGALKYHYEDENGSRADLDNSGNVSSSSVKKASNLPESYDLREQNTITSIKDQGVTGCCWAFAAIKSLESNLITKNLTEADDTDLSESHLTWYSLHTSTKKSDSLYKEGISLSDSSDTAAYLFGGNALISAFTLARWSGAVNESYAPFSGDSYTEISSMGAGMASASASLRYQKQYIMTDVTCYDEATQDEIKQAIMENGAMDVSLYYDSDYITTTQSGGTAYYQNYYTGDTAIENANHSVTIVGWDDTYPHENFGNATPSSDGAWLIANSYGSSFGESGYFWLSYEEPSLTEYYSFEGTSASTYDNNYQYDALGWGTGITLSNSSSIMGANIYTANGNYIQSLKAIGLYTLTDNQKYTIKIYRNVKAGKPTSGTLAATVSGTQALQGYHTIELPTAVSLKANEKFSVVLSYENTSDNNTSYLPIEGDDSSYSEFSINYTSNAGESFLYTTTSDSDTKSWYDISVYGSGYVQNNICVKAFTTNVENAGTVSFPKSSVKLGKGENYSAKATVKNTTEKTVTYASSNKKVATVSSTGKIKAKKKGRATITATLSTGATASIKVTVKKAPKKITLKPAKTKTINRKKSFRIKVKLPSGSASNKITYKSSRPKIAKVNANGKVTGKEKGTAVITVSTYNKKKQKLTVYVK